MPYDFEDAKDQLPPLIGIEPTQPDDLETIVVLLEVSAINLTREPDSLFSAEELIHEARSVGGHELNEPDVRIVLGHVRFLERVGQKLRLK